MERQEEGQMKGFVDLFGSEDMKVLFQFLQDTL